MKPCPCCCTLKDQINDLKVDVVTDDCCAAVGWVNVNADGAVASACGDGVTVNRTAVGTYQVTAPPDAQTVQLTVVETPTTDSIEIHPSTFTGGTITIHEGDNGAGANIPRDRAWTAVWFGTKSLVTGVSLG